MATVQHIVLPGHEIARTDALENETIGALLKRTGWSERRRINGRLRWSFRLPTILVANGSPVLQRHWNRRRIKAGDQIAFWSKPMGKSSGGKQIAGLVALLALSALAGPLGTAAAGAVGAPALAGVASGIVCIGGALLVTTRPSRWARLRQWLASTWSRRL